MEPAGQRYCWSIIFELIQKLFGETATQEDGLFMDFSLNSPLAGSSASLLVQPRQVYDQEYKFELRCCNFIFCILLYVVGLNHEKEKSIYRVHCTVWVLLNADFRQGTFLRSKIERFGTMSQNYYQEVSNYFGINTVKELIRNNFEKFKISYTVQRTTMPPDIC